MTLKNSISALCPLACCLRRFEAKDKCLSVRQSLLIISAKRWHSQTPERHTGLQALGWPRQEAAVGASSPGWRQGMVGQAWVWAAHRPEAQQLCCIISGAEQQHWHCARASVIFPTAKETGLMQASCEGPGALGKWGELHPHFTIAETPSFAAMWGSLVKTHPYWNGTALHCWWGSLETHKYKGRKARS